MAFLKRKTALPVVFITSASLLNLLILSGFYYPFNSQTALGGPEKIISGGNAFLESSPPLNFDIAQGPDEFGGFAVIDSSFLLSPGSPLSNILPTRDGLMIYKVQSGDTLSSVASNFGISLNTLFWANPNLKARSVLKVGQEVVVLPVSGVLHQVKENDTIASLSNQYSVSPDQITQFNPRISLGNTIIIPGAKPNSKSVSSAPSNLPRLAGYFAIPTTGWNWGRLHHNNAVDIANACGTAIYAAAEGLVVESKTGWNQGYGNVVVVEHPNNISTRYAHLQKSAVEVGQYIVQGDSVGYMGNTGNTHGPTGCHLHFEVAGAVNPFAK